MLKSETRGFSLTNMLTLGCMEVFFVVFLDGCITENGNSEGQISRKLDFWCHIS